MADATDSARRVFDLFQAAFEEHEGAPEAVWALDVYEECAAAGLSESVTGAGTRTLVAKGLIENFTVAHHRLTDLGTECCLHPELLDDYLAPRRPVAAVSRSVTATGGNVQIGDHNTQQITYRELLAEALADVDERDDVPAAVAGAHRKLRDFPDLEGLVSAAAKRAAKGR
jgi:hypothetical protein